MGSPRPLTSLLLDHKWEAPLGSKPSPPAPSKLISREEIRTLSLICEAFHTNSFSKNDVSWLLLRDGLSLYLYTNKNKPQSRCVLERTVPVEIIDLKLRVTGLMHAMSRRMWYTYGTQYVVSIYMVIFFFSDLCFSPLLLLSITNF